jgi:DnaK suppressor protein
MPLSKQDLADLKQLLIERRAELLLVKETGMEAANVVELDQTKVGRISRMDAMQAQAMSVETNRRRDIELQRIGIALGRLVNNEYGLCLKCDEEIARERLHVDPANPICIDCASIG